MTQDESQEGGNRFARAWNEWDDRIEEGKKPGEMLSDFSSEKIMRLLAGAGKERRYERDILATEAMNRLIKARHRIEGSTREVSDLVQDVQEQAQKTRESVHDTEEVVARLQGNEALGVQSPQEITAHSASDLVEILMSAVERAGAALGRLEDVREGDLERALGSDDDEHEKD